MLGRSSRWAAFLLALASSSVLEADDLNSLQGRLEQIEADNRQLREEPADLQARESLLAAPVPSVQERAAAAPDNPAPATGDPKAFSAKWNNGFEAVSKDKRFKYHVGGRVQFDSVFMTDNPEAFAGTGVFTDQDAIGFRRARLRADGTMYEVIDWCGVRLCEFCQRQSSITTI